MPPEFCWTIHELLKRGDPAHCAHCRSTTDLVRDHILALSNGGSDELCNQQILCRRCNSSKSDKPDPYKPGVHWLTQNAKSRLCVGSLVKVSSRPKVTGVIVAVSDDFRYVTIELPNGYRMKHSAMLMIQNIYIGLPMDYQK